VALGLLHGFVAVHFFRGGVVSPTPKPQPGGPDYTSSGPYPLTCLAWVAILGALRVTGAHKPSLHDKAVVAGVCGLVFILSHAGGSCLV
jgi:hypothetical protein